MRCASPIPLKVVTSPASRVGTTIFAGFVEPATVIMLIIVVGMNWRPAEAKIIVIIIGKVIVPLLSSIDSTALIPSGTEAPPIPRSEDEIDKDRYCLASLDRFLLQNLFITGESILEIEFDNGVFSTMFMIPSQTA